MGRSDVAGSPARAWSTPECPATRPDEPARDARTPIGAAAHGGRHTQFVLLGDAGRADVFPHTSRVLLRGAGAETGSGATVACEPRATNRFAGGVR